MIKHLIAVFAICLLLIICIFIPFLSGSYDVFAVMISAIVQFASFISLLLIPIAILWLIVSLFKKRWDFGFAISSLAVVTIFVIFSLFIAFGGISNFSGSKVMGFIIIISYIYILFFKVFKGLRNIKISHYKRFNPILIYLLIPLIVVIFRSYFIVPATEYSRKIAIENCTELIQDLENYYDKNGEYPVSLQGLWKDYSPGVLGIEKYYYEPNGKAYNVFFEQFTYDLFAREIVMYNKLDEHIIRSHPSFIFSLTKEEFKRYRGYFSEYSLPFNHWKYFWFD